MSGPSPGPPRGPRPQTGPHLAAVARAHRREVLVERAPADCEAAGGEARRAEVARSRERRERHALRGRVLLEAEDPRLRLRAERVELAAQDREQNRPIRPGREAQAGLPEGHRQAAEGDRHHEKRKPVPRRSTFTSIREKLAMAASRSPRYTMTCRYAAPSTPERWHTLTNRWVAWRSSGSRIASHSVESTSAMSANARTAYVRAPGGARVAPATVIPTRPRRPRGPRQGGSGTAPRWRRA